MEFEQVLGQIIKLAADQFKIEADEINENTTASDVTAWNSLSHVMLMSSIEKAFEIKFDLLLMAEMKSIGDIARATFEDLK